MYAAAKRLAREASCSGAMAVINATRNIATIIVRTRVFSRATLA